MTEQEQEEKEVEPAEEKICFNCTFFFPAELYEMTEYGICLDDSEFEPYLDAILELENLDCCRDLIERNKFPGERDACEKFEETQSIEIEADSPLAENLRHLSESGELTPEAVQDVLQDHWIDTLDISKVPVDNHVKGLRSNSRKIRKDAVRTLGGLIAQKNEKAFEALFAHFKELPPPETTEEVHLKRYILESLHWRENRRELIPVLVDELYQTKSNNTTRQWISEIFRFFERCDLDDVEEPLERMLKDKRFSYRLKRKMRSILEEEDFW